MRKITDIQRSEPNDGFRKVKLVDTYDTDKDDNSEDGSQFIEGQQILNSVVKSNQKFINDLVAVTSLGTNNIILS